MPLPVATLSNATSMEPARSAAETELRNIEGPAPGLAIWIRPTDPLTENREAMPFAVQEPPVSAGPHPLLTVRAKASAAIAPGVPPLTVTCRVVVLAAPLL